jgi:hypothetical protein
VRPGGHARNYEDLGLDCGGFCGEGAVFTTVDNPQQCNRVQFLWGHTMLNSPITALMN